MSLHRRAFNQALAGGVAPTGTPPAELAALIKADGPRLGTVVRESCATSQ